MPAKLLIAFLVSLLLAVSGCLSDDDDNDDDDEIGEGWPELQGVWESDCFVVTGEDGASDAPQVHTIAIDGDQAEQDVEIYDENDTTCSGAPIFEPFMLWRYEVGDEITTTGGVTAREIDVELLEDPDGVGEHDEEYDIFRLEDDDNTLYFGDEAGLSPEDRPDTLDFTKPFTRISD